MSRPPGGAILQVGRSNLCPGRPRSGQARLP
uniref:Uncharacterized protein n=1 Tax=Siphoviridae sp. ctrEg9 TaxID=2825688 RepID=A0A8S5PH51_9CAUD|nr:MAG TPA: hypothetical protein [Siphoviridae sp. ctrEg9]